MNNQTKARNSIGSVGVLLFRLVLAASFVCSFGPRLYRTAWAMPKSDPSAWEAGLTPTAFCDSVSEIPKAECEVLEKIYTQTNGPGWKNRTGWLTSNTPCSWFGVTCESGHVSELDLHYNLLSGGIPAELGDLSSLIVLSFGGNQLSGGIPESLGSLANLQLLDLGNNSLTGNIPAALGNLPNLTELSLSDNPLTGSLPADLGKLPKLVILAISNTQISGSIPPELGNLPLLQELYLTDNQLSGSIPAGLGNLSNLNTLDLSHNQLSGDIPAALSNLSKVELIFLFNNLLTGSIPAELGNLNSILWLDLAENQLSGSIPAALGNLDSLQYLYLPGNELSGSIPAGLGNLSNLMIFSLQRNQLTGSIPAQLGNLAALELLDLSENNLSGGIPSQFGNLSALVELYLNQNPSLSGELPASLADLSSLYSLYYDYTGLCTPVDAKFQAWLDTLDDLMTTGFACSGGRLVSGQFTSASLPASLAPSDGGSSMDGYSVEITSVTSGGFIYPGASGAYQARMLPGTYQLAPRHDPEAFKFMPEERSADLTVDVSGQDFLALPEHTLILDPGSPNTLVYTDTRGNPTTITAPAGAVTETIAITFTPVTINTTLPAGYAYGGHGFELKAYKTSSPLSLFSFQKPVAVTIRYSNGEVYGLEEGSLLLDYWNEAAGAWMDAATTCTPASVYDRRLVENTIGVGVCSTQRFALLGEEKQSNKLFLYMPLIRRP